MNPAPAISTLAMAGVGGSARLERFGQLARVLARRLGQPHGDVAGEVAVRGSRVRSTSMLTLPRCGRNEVLRAGAASAWRSNVSISVFKTEIPGA